MMKKTTKRRTTMKKYLFITMIGILVTACGGGSDAPGPGPDPGPDPGPTGNNAPTVPVLSAPENNLLCIDNNLEFSWSASSDAEEDAIKYTIEVSLDAAFTQITHSVNNITATSRTILLDRDQAYYWRVRASDSKNASSDFSSAFQLYTEGFGEENHLPFAPSLQKPEMDGTVQGTSASLMWGATDVDGDSLTFDIYLDTDPSPTTKVVADHPSKDYVASSLAAATTYYWKVVAKDGKGGITIGQVWSFTTN
ncbi:fibronectin type III domain-containing protein [Flavivirga algicola]|uniref:Fibronectin type-III domain-containing protein n=1 Tax=Flavivirga algicola TaxID=2729136 RepID=A0ABX1S1U8_9FLAO|nr:hypothetical protein [Flavivirga algicola]NMH88363.1 hypothetical protein [Flavivirga algicola]NMH88622.1 hypothetical protein [Flavivirga algicola]NMH88831.1 hypothetical protein [Flavivirga algicola]NMH89849.1 hypothetical protein [Flavivirga algicola]